MGIKIIHSQQFLVFSTFSIFTKKLFDQNFAFFIVKQYFRFSNFQFCSKGSYQSNMCGGGSNRRCCVEQNFELGDYYWNHYSGYALSGYATSTDYKCSSLSAAQEKCISLANSCSGQSSKNTARIANIWPGYQFLPQI